MEVSCVRHDSIRYDYFIKKDIESIINGVLLLYKNNDTKFECIRYCNKSYIDKITESLKQIFLDCDILIEENSENHYYTIKIDWSI